MDWEFNAENQKKFDEVTANIRRLQAELGIKPMSIAERAAEYKKDREVKAQMSAQLGAIRPVPKWKI